MAVNFKYVVRKAFPWKNLDLLTMDYGNSYKLARMIDQKFIGFEDDAVVANINGLDYLLTHYRNSVNIWSDCGRIDYTQTYVKCELI